MKPVKALVFSTAKGQFRPIFKRKIAAFAEDKRFHQAQKWTLPPFTTSPDKLDQLKWEASYQVTENRLLSAISKIGYRGPHEPSRSRQLFHLLVADILEQLALYQPDLLADLAKAEQQELLTSIQKEVRELFKQFFQKGTRHV